MSNSILLIEDDVDIQENLKFFLELEGYQVSAALNGKEGLDLLLSGTRPSLILLDLMMPVMSGYEFLEELQARNLGLGDYPVIILSAALDAERLARAKQLSYVAKPIDLEQLSSQLRKNIPSVQHSRGSSS